MANIQETITFALPELGEGEIHIGCIRNAEGQLTHIILLPGNLEGSDWKTAKAWAQAQGGDLPTRIEQALVFATQREQFEPDWYWSCERHAEAEACAWLMNFAYGNQYGYHIYRKFRARAVRRWPI